MKEFENITKTTKSKPLVKASEVKVDTISKPPMKKMIKFSESSDPPPFVQKTQPKKSLMKEKPLPEDPEEIYEEDFEEFKEEEEKPDKRSGSHQRSSKSPDYSLETLKRELEKENAAALKKEEEVSESTIMHITSQNNNADHVDAKMIAKQQRRNKEISEFVKLDKESFSIFELLPLTEYDHLITKVNQGELKSTGTQSREDNVEKEMQCMDIEKCDFSTQWPGDLSSSFDVGLQNSSIQKFLTKVAPMMEILLEENINDKPNKVNVKKNETEAGEIISQMSISSISFLAERFPESSFEVKDLLFFQSKKHLLCAVYSVGTFGSLIVVWDIQNTAKPNRILLSVNEITSICTSASKEHIVIAGNSIGSLELWDLREPGSSHEVFKIDEKKRVSIRSPTYTTDSLEMYTHEGKILKIIEIPSGKNENFSILVSDSEGNLVTWTVIEMVNSDIDGVDFGLRIGGRVKIVKSHRTSIREIFPKNKTSACSALALDFSDFQRFLFASPSNISFGNRFGTETSPSVFEKLNSEAISINFASSNQYFLVGYTCGSVSLYDKNFSAALSSWTECVGAIIKIAWDVSGRCGFFTIDKDQVLSVWDLKRSTNGPVCKIKIETEKWNAVDWVLPESSKHSLILAVSIGGEIKILNLR